MSPATASCLHQRLRRATRAGHAAVNRHPLLLPLLDPALTPVEYGDALAALHGMVSTAERIVVDYLARHPTLYAYGTHPKSIALEADLAALGRAPLTLSTRWPAAHSHGALFGLLYILEGATLGGEFIARHLRDAGGATLPLAFHGIYGDTVRAHWERFLQDAQTRCPLAEHAQAADMAARWFATLEVHLDAAQRHLAGR